MKSKIIAIVGPSGCGKTTMAEYLKTELGIPVISSFTTRPMRPGEKNGREHTFVTDADIPAKEEMIAYTFFGGYHYWAARSQVPENGICSYVIDEKGLQMLHEKFSNQYEIVGIYVQRPESDIAKQCDKDRMIRDNERIHISADEYDAIINNDGSLESFQKQILSTIQKFI